MDRLAGDAEEGADLGPAEAGVSGPAYGDLLAARQCPLLLAHRGELVDRAAAVVGGERRLHGCQHMLTTPRVKRSRECRWPAPGGSSPGAGHVGDGPKGEGGAHRPRVDCSSIAHDGRPLGTRTRARPQNRDGPALDRSAPGGRRGSAYGQLVNPSSADVLYLTHPQGRLHVRMCPHLADTASPVEATPEQVTSNETCAWCVKELAGQGRTYFEELDDAFHAFGHTTDHARRLIREVLGDLEWNLAWIPASGSYIALGLDGRAVAWIGNGYVEVKGRPAVELLVARCPPVWEVGKDSQACRVSCLPTSTRRTCECRLPSSPMWRVECR